MNRSDPEYRLSIEERKATAVSQFERGAISEAVFRASLFAAGMRGEAIDVEVRLHGSPQAGRILPAHRAICRRPIRRVVQPRAAAGLDVLG